MVVYSHGNHLHVSALKLSVKLILGANHHVVGLSIAAELVVMVTKSSLVRLFLAVAFEIVVTHLCDRQLVRKRGLEIATAATLVLMSFGGCGK